MSKRIEQLRLALETLHNCKARHEASTPVLETFRHQKVWEEVVETFALTGHPMAKQFYARSLRDMGETQCVPALEIPPVESTVTAVRAAIAAEAKGKK